MSDKIQPANAIPNLSGARKAGEQTENLDPARADYKKGREHLKNGDLAEAAACFHNALQGFEEQGDNQGVANALDRLGDVCFDRGELSMALSHYERCRQICKEFKDPDSVFTLNQKIVNTLWRTGERSRALSTCFDILDHFHACNNPQGSVEILDTIATLYLEMGKKSDAADAYRTIASIHKNFGHKRLAEQNLEKAAAAEKE